MPSIDQFEIAHAESEPDTHPCTPLCIHLGMQWSIRWSPKGYHGTPSGLLWTYAHGYMEYMYMGSKGPMGLEFAGGCMWGPNLRPDWYPHSDVDRSCSRGRARVARVFFFVGRVSQR